jgi:hypothetical protein
MPSLHAIESLAPIQWANLALDLGRHGKMGGMTLVHQPEQMLKRAERTEKFGAMVIALIDEGTAQIGE